MRRMIEKENGYVYEIEEFEDGSAIKNYVGCDTIPKISIEATEGATFSINTDIPFKVECVNFEGLPFALESNNLLEVSIYGPNEFQKTFELETESGVVEFDFSTETAGDYLFIVRYIDIPSETTKLEVKVNE
jgi:hypothetical protein